MNCRLQKVVHAIRCSRCDVVVYVDETERQVQDRMKEHLRDVRFQRDKPIMSHFRDTHDDGDLWFSVLKKNCTMPVIWNGYSERPCGLKVLKRGGRMGAMSKTLFCHSSFVAKCGRWFGRAARAAAGCTGARVRSASAVRGGGCPGARFIARIFAIAVGWWASVGTARVRGAALLVAVVDIWAGPRSLVAVAMSGRGCRWRGLARIFAVVVGGLRLGLPRPRLWRWWMSGRGRTGERSRPALFYCGRAARMPSGPRWLRWRGPCGKPGGMCRSARTLLNRLVGVRRACASARSRLDHCCCGRRGLGRSARLRRLVVAFADVTSGSVCLFP